MPKISKPLTTTEVKSYKAESKMYKKPDGKGLWLVVKPNGTKSWRFDFRYGNKNLIDVTLLLAKKLAEKRF